ncbi:MAG TPA: discoidin domain-containing protein [Chloroflexota bacterium]|nr:discoidin domain-containing protein [Chloroflexota bacterium]
MPIRLLPVLVLLALTLPAHAELRNVALASDGALIASSSDYGAQAAPIAIDGKWNGPGDPADANRWHSALGRPHPHWLWIRFRQPAEISKFVVRRADLLGYPVDFRVEYEPVGGGAMRTLFEVKDNKMTADLWVFERSFEPVVADGVRLWISRSSNEQYTNWSQISEMEVFGEYVGGARKEQNAKAPVDKLPQPQLKPTAHEGLTVTKGPDEIEFRSKWLRIVASRKSARVNALCWDSLGEGKVDTNLLKPGPNGGARFGLTPIFSNGSEQDDVRVDTNGNVIRYTLSLPGGIAARWADELGKGHRALD